MQIVELHTDLFPDAETVIAALRQMPPQHSIERIDVSRPEMGKEAWDGVLAAILAADLVVTT